MTSATRTTDAEAAVMPRLTHFSHGIIIITASGSNPFLRDTVLLHIGPMVDGGAVHWQFLVTTFNILIYKTNNSSLACDHFEGQDPSLKTCWATFYPSNRQSPSNGQSYIWNETITGKRKRLGDTDLSTSGSESTWAHFTLCFLTLTSLTPHATSPQLISEQNAIKTTRK